MNPYVVGFSLSLIPITWLYRSQKELFAARKETKDPDRAVESAAKKYATANLHSPTSRANQQLFQAIFAARHEPDLYTALGEKNRKSAQETLKEHQNPNETSTTKKASAIPVDGNKFSKFNAAQNISSNRISETKQPSMTIAPSETLYSATGMLPKNAKGPLKVKKPIVKEAQRNESDPAAANSQAKS
jgi:dsDNA-binding SOS-regulon protein